MTAIKHDRRAAEVRIGRRIATSRKAAGLTQEGLCELATAAGLNLGQQTLAKIERGVRPLRASESEVLDMIIFAVSGGAS